VDGGAGRVNKDPVVGFDLSDRHRCAHGHRAADHGGRIDLGPAGDDAVKVDYPRRHIGPIDSGLIRNPVEAQSHQAIHRNAARGHADAEDQRVSPEVAVHCDRVGGHRPLHGSITAAGRIDSDIGVRGRTVDGYRNRYAHGHAAGGDADDNGSDICLEIGV